MTRGVNDDWPKHCESAARVGVPLPNCFHFEPPKHAFMCVMLDAECNSSAGAEHEPRKRRSYSDLWYFNTSVRGIEGITPLIIDREFHCRFAGASNSLLRRLA